MQVITKLKFKMKTRHFLTALALPALLAACTADEFDSPNFNNEQGQRPLLSKDFALTLAGDASTRYAVDGEGTLDFKWTEGDQLGAVIIDNFDSKNPKDPSKWEIIPSTAGNNPFVYQASSGVWKAFTRLGIGHYLFTYSYNPDDNGRGAMKYSLPTIQELYESEDGDVDLNHTIKLKNKSVAAALLEEDDATLTADLKNLFAYPKFVIRFDNGQKVNTVTKVVLNYKGDGFGHNNGTNAQEGFLVKGGFDHEKTYELFAGANAPEVESVKKYWDDVTNTADFLREYKGELSDGYTTFEYNPYLIAKLPKGTELKAEAGTNNKYIEVRFMMPGAKLTYGTNGFTGGIYNETLDMYIYTDNGVYVVKDVVNSIVFNKTTSKETKERILVRNASYNLKINKDSVEPADKDLYIVTNTEDWNELVAAYGETAAYNENEPLEVAVVGDDFTLNASAKMPSKAVFQINTDVKVEGKVTLSNVKCEGEVTVKEKAELTTSGTFSAKSILNQGVLEFATVEDENENVVVYEGVENVKNEGVLNIGKEAIAKFSLNNVENAIVNNNGEILVEEGENWGVINNEGVMKTVGDFTNGKTEYVNGEVKNMPTIENNGDILAMVGTLKNEGTIINNGEIACKSGTEATIENAGEYGLIDSQKDKITYITRNRGLVIVYEANPGSDIKIDAQNGVVRYATENKAENFKGSIVNEVIASTELTISDQGKVKKLTMMNGGKLTLPGEEPSIETLIVKKGEVVLGDNLKVTQKLTIEKGASITVPAGKTMKVELMENYGSILVSGTFETPMKSTDEGAGVVKEDGSAADVVWDSNNSDVNTFKTKLREAVKGFINNSSMYTANYKVIVADFEKFRNNGETYGRGELNSAMNALGKTTVTQKELDDVVNAIAEDNKTGFLKTVKENATFVAQSKLYDTEDSYVPANAATGTKEKTSAYKDLRDELVKGAMANTMVTGLTGDNTLFVSASKLTTAEIRTLIAEKNPTMFVWTDCKLDKLVALWKEYDGVFADATSNDYSEAKAAGTATDKDKAEKLVNWVTYLLNQTSTNNPNLTAVQKALAAEGIGITATPDVKPFGNYTNAQMSAVDEDLLSNN